MSSVFKIFSTEDCNLYYDGELQGHISANSDKSFRFEVQNRGSYRMRRNSSHRFLILRCNIPMSVVRLKNFYDISGA